eukprot:scaffold284895_cov17-Prasinocladus_malaysianus.AAC.2
MPSNTTNECQRKTARMVPFEGHEGKKPRNLSIYHITLASPPPRQTPKFIESQAMSCERALSLCIAAQGNFAVPLFSQGTEQLMINSPANTTLGEYMKIS